MVQSQNTLLTVLNFSGGKQSSALLWMVIMGIIEKPDNFIVLNADPGMENSETYYYIDFMKSVCKNHDIDFLAVPGPNLYKDIIGLSDSEKTRLDNPKYWTDNGPGKKEGMLMQKCTKHYKIAPMDREIRRQLETRFGISAKSRRIGEGIVEKWIGFSYSEIERIKPPEQKYIKFRYPLIERKMNNDDVVSFFKDHKLNLPPRSVCNACFANGTKTLMSMYIDRPEDWKQAVNVDNAIRDWSQIGVEKPVYVSKTLVPLEELAKTVFSKSEDLESDYSCDSGYCFL